MRRRDLLRHLRQRGCQFVREGREHSIWGNPATDRRTSIPGHREVQNHTAEQICKQLGIPPPS
ncbi:MAG: type II toxin-antitoxin system HicA family toxin [Chloroflexi bacterium]|nr:type II toxin-antitoxin system HicA family toxin [Chloroflexota bacterium]